MKLEAPAPGSRRGAVAAPGAAFTLPEMLIAVTLFVLLVGGIVAGNLFGLRIYQVTENKLDAADRARKAIGKMADEIRSCKTTWVGSVSNSVFVSRLDGEAQTGAGLLIYPTTNTTSFIMYFLNPSDQSFRRTTSVPGTTTILARCITNSAIFCAEDHLGNVLTNNQNNRVIHLTLEFFQKQRQGVVADYYKLETSVTRRVLE
jgi:type II secretory pathway pseudopilin PulG